MPRLLNGESPFYRAYSAAADLVILNVVTLLACLPVVTAGAALTALARVVADMVREEEGYLLRTWWRAFRGALPQSLGWWLPFMALESVGAWEYRLLTEAGAPRLAGPMSGLVLAGMLCFAGVIVWLVPLSAVFDNRLGAHLGNAVRLAVHRLDITLACLLVLAAPLLTAWLVPASLPAVMWFLVLVGLSFCGYLMALAQRGVMGRLRAQTS